MQIAPIRLLSNTIALALVLGFALPASSALVIRTWEGLPAVIPPTGCQAGPGSGAGDWFSIGWGCDGSVYADAPNNGPGVEYEVRIDQQATNGSVVTLDGFATIDKLSIGPDTNDELVLDNAARLTIIQRNNGASGSIENLGRVSLSATSTQTDLVLSGGLVTLSGGGTVELGDDTQNRIYGLALGDGLVNVDNVIQGAGMLGVNLMSLDNQGIILATGSNDLVIDPNADGVTNSGVLRAFGGGTLFLQSGSFDNNGGEIDARDLSAVELNAAVVQGGDLRGSGSGEIRIVGNSTIETATTVTSDASSTAAWSRRTSPACC